MIDSFGITIGIVLGILLPVIVITSLVFFFWLMGNIILDMWCSISDYIAKKPPYDTIETSRDFMSNNVRIRFYRKNKMVWEHSIANNELKENK